MGDHFRPGYDRGGGRPRDNHYDDRFYRGREYDRGRDYYDYDRRPPPARDYPPPPPNYRGGGFAFRGAADRPYNFDFEPPRDAPRFPSEREINDRYRPPPSAPQRSRNPKFDERRPGANGSRPIDVARQRHANHRPRGGFQPKAAHTRQILSATHRETTPEQLEGMNADGLARFQDVQSSDDSDDHDVVDLTQDSDDEADGKRKRVKTELAPVEPSGPKWSNPDPYTALPPPESLGAPKKDIVQVIRKAKVDSAPKDSAKNAVSENADFISFNFDNDTDDGNASEGSDMTETAPANAPTAPKAFSHKAEFHTKISSAQAKEPSFTPTNQQLSSLVANVDDGGPPPPPPGFVMPSDQELMEQYLNDGKGTERKRKDNGPKRKGDVVDEWESNDTEPTPWFKSDHGPTAKPGMRLHKEICDFFDFVRPYNYEEAVRRELIDRIQQATRRCDAKGAAGTSIHCFGSFAAGLYLPTADMDLVATSPGFMSYGQRSFGQSATQMHKLANYLQYAGIAAPGGVAVVSKARVPIIKFADKKTGIKVDVSFENDSGIIANKTFQQWKEIYPSMPVIVVLVKQLLAMRGLNEVYTGGIGGFTTICLVVSMMQMMPELQLDVMDGKMHYGELLMNFLDLYGNKFDIEKVGICLNPPGYFDKIKNPMPRQNVNRLTIMDPNNASNDISGGSAGIVAVLDCFQRAHAAIQRRLAQINAGYDSEGSILGCVWGGNYSSFIHQREKLSMLHRGYAVSPPPPPAPKPLSKKEQKATNKAERLQIKQQKQAQQFVRPADANGRTHAYPLPAKPPPPASHPLPPRPTFQRAPRGPESAVQPQVQQNNVGSTSQAITAPAEPESIEDGSDSNDGLTDRQRRRQKLEQNRIDRANQWKAAHPEVEDKPESLTHNGQRKLDFKYKFNISSGGTWVPPASKKKIAENRAKEFQKDHPGVTVPAKMTHKQMKALKAKHEPEKPPKKKRKKSK